MKVLYIYSGTRKGRFSGKMGVDYPDTQFYGLNHLEKFGVDAEYKEPSEVIRSPILRRVLGWRIMHSLMYFTARRYDIVFGISILYMMLWCKVIPTNNTKFIMYNSALKRLFLANKNKPIKLAFITWLLKELDGVVTLSESQKKYIGDKVPFLKDKLFSVPLGVDLHFYKYKNEGRKNYCLSVGRDNSRDYNTIIEVAREMPDREFHFVCLPRNVSNIDDIPDNIKISFNLSFLELRKKFEEAKMLLLITHDADRIDGSGEESGVTVLVESMAVGVPIIATHKPYIDEYVKNGHNALLVDVYSKEQIIKKILELDNPLVVKSLTESARKTAESMLSTEKMAEKFSEIFKKIYETN